MSQTSPSHVQEVSAGNNNSQPSNTSDGMVNSAEQEAR